MDTATHLARIGDAELVSKSQPLQKQFYTESSEVANMSAADVKAWQTERAIVVEGSSLRPILQFSQSGGLVVHLYYRL